VSQRDAIVSERPARLIVPHDGSRAADHAVPVAQFIAHHLQIPVTVVQVFENVKQLSSVSDEEIDWSENAEPRAHIRTPAALRESVDLLIESEISVEVIGRVGTASEEILRELELAPETWIVMTSQGASGVRRLLLGSTARNVIRSTRGPVVLVPSEKSGRIASKPLGWKRIAVFLDGTPGAESSICSAAALAEAIGMVMDLVRVAETFRDEPGVSLPDEQRWEMPARAEVDAYLDRVLNACSNVRAETRTLTLSGSPVLQLTAYVENEIPDIVTLAVRKRSGIERWTYGSLAERLLDTLTVPLLLVPDPES
jgi:nucleotide-binding universal stress UspA family protein